jgi:penicillin-binding protein 2
MLKPRNVPYERLELVWVAFALVVGIYCARLVQLQVVKNAYYLQAAQQNATMTIYQNAPRGKILDRHGKVLATNRPSFTLIYLPSRTEDPAELASLAEELAPHLDRTPADLLEDLKQAAKSAAPTRLAENLGTEEMFKLSELKNRFAGIDLISEARRYYPNGAMAAHLLGYIGAMDSKDWEDLRLKGYRADSWVGRTGAEKLFERQLRGIDGGVQLEVDAHGRLSKVLRRLPWSPGGSVALTLDVDVQRAAEEALAKTPSGEGAVVAIDPRNGDVLALASIPSYDPNMFLVRKDEQIQTAIRQIPEFNLALQGTYPPGSTFKIVSGAAALNEGKVGADERFNCPGRYVLGRHVFMCWERKGHSLMDFVHGLAHSCDVYYYNLGLKTGGALIEEYEKKFRIGERTHIALPGERRGQRFGPEQRGSRGWWNGDNLNLAIGQGELLVTPVQIAVMVGGVANGGTFYRPHFVSQVVDRYGRVVYDRKSEVLSTVDLKDSTWRLIRDGLRLVVKDGTGKICDIPGLDVRGKTGTAQNPNGKDHAWFTAYAGLPDEPPDLAIAVLVQHGGHGASAAGPVARKVIEAVYKEYLEKNAIPTPVPGGRENPMYEEDGRPGSPIINPARAPL